MLRKSAQKYFPIKSYISILSYVATTDFVFDKADTSIK